MKDTFDLFVLIVTPLFNLLSLWMLLKQRRSPKLIAILYGISVAIGVFLSFLSIYDRYPVLFVLVAVPMFVVVTYCYEGTFWQKFFAVWCVANVSVLIGFSSSPIAAALAPYGSERFYGFLIIMMTVLYATVMILIHLYMRSFFQNLFRISGHVWILYSAGAILSRGILTVIALPGGVIAVNDPPPVGTGGVFLYYIVIFASVWCLVSTCLAVRWACSRMDIAFEERSTQNALTAARNHYAALSESLDDARRLRHDVKYTYAAIAQLAERNDNAGILSLINANEVSVTPRFFCSHTIADALFNWFADRCERANISLTIFASLPNSVPIDSGDLCVLLGNLMENAVCGAMSAPHDDRFIQVNVKAEERMLSLSIENSFDGVLLHEGMILKSRKESGGIGLKRLLFTV
jgi:hypothetical protein